MTPVLAVRDLTVRFGTRHGTLTAVNRVSFDIARGETVAVVGESGCGKSTLARALVGLVRPAAGSIRLNGRETACLRRRAMRPLRRQIQLIFQDPEASLNPRRRVGRIIEEPLLVHRIGDRLERWRRVRQLLAAVGLPATAASLYPHEFSGGQRQRIGIARAIALHPDIVVADEPVSALDVSIQAQIINLLVDLQRDLGLAYLFISHDLSVVRHVADRVMVMYLGRVVEEARQADLWAQPLHPYTRALFAAVPRTDRSGEPTAGQLLEGEVPDPLDPPSGCAFRPRCAFASAICAARRPEPRPFGAAHTVACHHAEIAFAGVGDAVGRGDKPAGVPTSIDGIGWHLK